MTEQKKADIALSKARNFHDGDPKPFLAEMEWEEHLMKEQQALNRAIMVEQHKLNKRIVIIAAIITALSGIFGGLIQKYGPDISWFLKSRTHIQTNIDRDTNIEATKPRETSTINETSSSKSLPKEKRE